MEQRVQGVIEIAFELISNKVQKSMPHVTEKGFWEHNFPFPEVITTIQHADWLPTTRLWLPTRQ